MERVASATDAAREARFAAVSANDHFMFSTPWLDGPIALASMVERSGDMELATTIALSALRGPLPLAKALAALDVLSGGRVVAGLGPGSSQRDYDVMDVDFEQRWARFDESVEALRALLGDRPLGERGPHFPLPDELPRPGPVREGGIPLWIGSWGSEAGLRRVAKLADGWLASAYNTTVERFAAARDRLGEELRRRGREDDPFPCALATMWTWVSEDASEVQALRDEMLAPLLRRDPAELAPNLCIGSAEHCAEVLSSYARAGCDRVYLWLLGDERRQIERIAADVAPLIASAGEAQA